MCECVALVQSKKEQSTIYIKARSHLTAVLLTFLLLFCDNYIISTLQVTESPRWVAALAWILPAFTTMMEKEKVSQDVRLQFWTAIAGLLRWLCHFVTAKLRVYFHVCYYSLFIAAVSCILHFLFFRFPVQLLIVVVSSQEWAAKQSTLKEEEIEITFSYWDGSGHRRTVRMKKGNWQPLMMYSDVWY